MTTQEHTHDSAMSGEVKEKWEEFEQNFPTKIQVIEKGIYEDSWRFTGYFKDTFSKFIHTQRSLAQQEILDRASEMIFDHEWFESDGTEDDADFVKHIRWVLSTLKDTNI